MVAETPSGAETGQCLTEVLHRRRRGCSIRGTLAEPDLGGLTHFSVERWPLGGSETPPPRTMTSSMSFMVILGQTVGTCGMLEKPLEG
jgi:hypothetical protein